MENFRPTLIWALYAIITAAPVNATEFDFKGTRIGDSEKTVTTALPWLTCAPGDGALSDRRCNTSLRDDSTLADVPAFMMFHFYNDELHTIYATFDTTEFAHVRAAMLSKYGTPAESNLKTVRNRMGAEFENHVIKWTFGDTEVRLMQRANDLTEAAVAVTSTRYREEFNARAEAARKKGAKDL